MSNTGGVYTWSKTAASNATADNTVNWAEGQSPSSVNDSARAMMSSVAKWRDDISGSIVTSGTSSAYTLSSNQGFDSLSDMAGMVIALSPHTNSATTVTLNVDFLGAKPLRTSPGIEIGAGVLVEGAPYVAVYNNSDAVFYLQGFYSTATLNVTNLTVSNLTVTSATFNGTVTADGTVALESVVNAGASASIDFSSITSATRPATGTTGQRAGSPNNGDLRFNSTLGVLEFYNGTIWIQLGAAPTVQRFTSGTAATYTPSTGVVRIRVRMCGGGGGAGATGTGAGSNGNTTSFGSWTCIGGNGGTASGGGVTGGNALGGTGGANGTGTLIARFPGNVGGSGWGVGPDNVSTGGIGGSNPFGGGAPPAPLSSVGANALANTGGGGSGGANGNNWGNGGGAGEYAEFWVTNPGATTYTVGSTAAGGSTSGNAGGTGAAGIIIVEEFYI